MEVTRRSLELDQRSSLVLVTIENDFLNGLVVLVILDQGTEQLINHAALHSVSLANLCALLQMLNASLDEIGAALPLKFSGTCVEELDCAGCVIEYLLAFKSHGPHLHSGALLGPVGGSRNAEQLFATLCNKRLWDHDVADVEATIFPFRLVLLDQELGQGLGDICIERLFALLVKVYLNCIKERRLTDGQSAAPLTL